ncbi:hypothetical protein COU18_03460 [Candidatus Kaiserbacteria bacterium CG10_big_fil_rev_8_21_14_0_10_51_14]|uniref:Sugar ABC transporter substrate-binding protein n=1 Tax=Candidatus Kaiserbacteria bacterium CG10_big_fil_rev_8_21_14_0_10_51_14 TaxID=1974610 RepID=A0A2H0UD45_9BACT|nr:MAG: hypothetical protein COU18_03460 [Candidatus Kaiserbacteria bacterium CG10_big_fil_rev_8_21_14_0_10_51_14]
MKKPSLFQIILLAVFGSLAVVGVLIFAFAVGGGQASTVGPINIWGTLDQTAFGSALQGASEEIPEFKQVTYEQKDGTTYESNLTEALASGTGPDLFILRQDYALKNVSKVATVPFSIFSQVNFENTFIEASKPFLTPDGFVAVPLLADPLVLYVNKDMLASAGIAEPPKYWDELFNMSKKLTIKDDSGSIRRSAVALGEYQNVPHAKDILATLIIQAGGAVTRHDTEGDVISALGAGQGSNAQGAVSALRFFTEFADPSKDDYSWNRSLPDAQRAFAAGDVALYIGYASEASLIARTNSNLNYAIAPLPQVRGSRASLTYARVYGLAVSRIGRNPNGAITVAFLLADKANSYALSRALGLSPSRRDLLQELTAQNSSASSLSAGTICTGQDIALCSTIFARSWSDPDPERTDQIFRAMIENTTSGAEQVSEAVQRADRELGQLLGQ